MDTLGIEPRASRMLSGCDTTTPRARMMKAAMAKTTLSSLPDSSWTWQMAWTAGAPWLKADRHCETIRGNAFHARLCQTKHATHI